MERKLDFGPIAADSVGMESKPSMNTQTTESMQFTEFAGGGYSEISYYEESILERVGKRRAVGKKN